MAVSLKQYRENVFIRLRLPTVCASQRMNSGQIRLEKIADFIRDSRYSIHDLSRTEIDERYSLPRFNMPLELGIAIGCAKFGSQRQRQKTALILDRRQYCETIKRWLDLNAGS